MNTVLAAADALAQCSRELRDALAAKTDAMAEAASTEACIAEAENALAKLRIVRYERERTVKAAAKDVSIAFDAVEAASQAWLKEYQRALQT